MGHRTSLGSLVPKLGSFLLGCWDFAFSADSYGIYNPGVKRASIRRDLEVSPAEPLIFRNLEGVQAWSEGRRGGGREGRRLGAAEVRLD